MDDLYTINTAKTVFREAFNTGNMTELDSVLDPEVVAFADSRPCAFGPGAAETLRAQYREMAERYRVHLDPIVIEIRLEGGIAYDYGWHIWSLTPLKGGDPLIQRERYVDIWRKNAAGEWKLWMFMNNADVPMAMPQTAAA